MKILKFFGKIRYVISDQSTLCLQTVRFKNELERNITIKLGYANAKIYRCENKSCPRPMCYKWVLQLNIDYQS